MCYNKLNVKFYCIVLPVKSSIYPEQLPDIIKRKNQPSRLSQLTDFLKAFFKILIVANSSDNSDIPFKSL